MRQLSHQISRHLVAVSLVGGIELVAKGRAAAVEGHRQVAGRLLADQAQENVGEAVDCVGRQTAAVGERGNGVVGAIDIGAAVHQINRSVFFHGLLP
jgi:hypothetical protein